MLGTFNKIISNLWSSRGETDVDAKLLKLSHDKSLACDLVNKLRFHLNLWIGVRSRLAHLFLSFEHSVGRWSSLMDAHNSFNMIRLIIHVRSKSLTRISAEQRFLTHVEHFFYVVCRQLGRGWENNLFRLLQISPIRCPDWKTTRNINRDWSRFKSN